jgi:hypothetical protein
MRVCDLPGVTVTASFVLLVAVLRVTYDAVLWRAVGAVTVATLDGLACLPRPRRLSRDGLLTDQSPDDDLDRR